MGEQKFKLHDRCHDGMNPGEIIQVDEARGLYLFEYEVWPGEPLGSKWCKADDLRPEREPGVIYDESGFSSGAGLGQSR